MEREKGKRRQKRIEKEQRTGGYGYLSKTKVRDSFYRVVRENTLLLHNT